MKKIGNTTDGSVLVTISHDELAHLSGTCDLLKEFYHAAREMENDKRMEQTHPGKALKFKPLKPGAGKVTKKQPKPILTSEIGRARLYSAAHALLVAHGPMTREEMVQHLKKQGFDTSAQRLSVIVSTYKNLFAKAPGHKWAAIQKEAPKTGVRVLSPAEAKVARADLIKALERKRASGPAPVMRTDSAGSELDQVSEFKRARQMAQED